MCLRCERGEITRAKKEPSGGPSLRQRQNDQSGAMQFDRADFGQDRDADARLHQPAHIRYIAQPDAVLQLVAQE
jgi:hypothetical protein